MSKNPYDNIDYCLELLYDAIYKNDENICINFEQIDKKSLTINDIKKPDTFNYDDILNSKFKFHGFYNNRIHYTRFGLYPSTMSIGFMNKKYNRNDILRQELYHMAMLYMSSELVYQEKFNHILLPIMFFDIKKKDLLKKIPNIEKDFGDKFEKDNDNMYIIITEHYHKIIPLKEYLDENKDTITIDEIKSILFQILITLHKLNDKFNKFRHNRLNMESILIVPKNSTNDKFKIGLNEFIIENNKFDVKITDFDYSYHQSEYPKNDNKTIILENGNVENPYYDIHYIHNLLMLYFEKNIDNNNLRKIYNELKIYFNEIIAEI